MSLIRVNINGKEIETTPGKSILIVAQENGIDIPHLCYDDRLEAYGGCGLCVVEIEGLPKLQRACATPVQDGMIIKTHTNRTIETRKAALNLLVSDHRGDCRPPCALACPGHTDCQGYVGLIANGQFKEAVALIKEQLPLPASIGIVCPHPCEEACRRQLVEEPIAIAALKRFVGEIDLEEDSYMPEIKPCSGKSIAVVGAGPAGLSAAFFLAKEGHKVTIFEAMPKPGGMLRYGIPQYRLPKEEVLDKEVALIEKMGVEIRYNVKIGDDISLQSLSKKYDAVFLGIGAWKSSSIRCEGEDKEGVLGGIDFLREVTINGNVNIGKRVAVVGGGNTAMDVARTAVRLGAEEVNVLYRRTRDEMPAEDVEIDEAEEEGVVFNYLVAPIEILGDGKATGIRCQKMRLGEPDESGRRKPVPIEGEEVVFEVDTVIGAIGQQVTLGNISGLNTTKRNTIEVKEGTFQTNISNVFAGGDAVTGPKIAIQAIGQGKEASEVINSFLEGEIKPVFELPVVEIKDLTEEDFKDRERIARVKQSVVASEERKDNFRQISYRMTAEEAMHEASRCLECGCKDYFECQLIKYIREYDIDPKKAKGEKHHRYEEDYHPFIERNPDKCILCSQCIRACDEVMGVTALGLIDRGFDSLVAPEFGLPLKETDCISCGQCVDVCPVGAVIEKTAVKKQVPVKYNTVDSVCAYCGVGCNIHLDSNGRYIYRARPNKDIEEGVLCARGKFGIEHVNNKERIKHPIVNGKEVTFNVAYDHIVKKLRAIKGLYGKDSIAVVVSPRFTNEELFLLNKIAYVLDTTLVGSFNMDKGNGLLDILGYNASTNSYEELNNTDLILSVGNISENHPVMDVKIRNANKGKAKVVSVSQCSTRLDNIANISYRPENDLNFLKGLIKALIELGYVKENEVLGVSTGYSELKDWVKDAVVDTDIEAIAKAYGEAKKAIIVVEEDSLTDEAIKLLGNISVITGKVGKPHRGVIVVREKNNTQGALDMGIQVPGEEILEKISEGQVKAVLVLGEDPAKANENVREQFEKLDFLGVFDLFMTETANMAEIVLPIGSAYESEGTVTRSDRRIQKLNISVNPILGKTNFEILLGLGEKLNINYRDLKEIRQEISKTIPEYKGMLKLDEVDHSYWPNNTSDPEGVGTIYTEGFKTEDGKAHLFIGTDGKLFKEKTVYDTIEINFLEYMEKKDIR